MQSPFNKPTLKPFRKKLRNNLTPAEATLWTLLKGKQLAGWKFRRQYSVDNYVLDFYCPKARLGIELDGAGHFTPAGMEHDEARTQHIRQYNIKIIRFENQEVFNQPEAVLEEILNNLTTPSSPSGSGHPS